MPGLITLDASNTGLYNIVLNGATFFIRTYWNQYVNRWCMDFSDIQQTPISMGMTIVSRKNLFDSKPELSLTIGEIWPIDLRGGDCQERDQLGITVQLIYFTPGEFEQLFPNFNEQLFRPLNYIFDDLFTVV